ncbi:hypothetical protein EBB07_18165 [Paenibacillaceae bacterium]|nr:hypothetical protein EBB07_18165 [Paenibacillaceae bacterium]
MRLTMGSYEMWGLRAVAAAELALCHQDDKSISTAVLGLAKVVCLLDQNRGRNKGTASRSVVTDLNPQWQRLVREAKRMKTGEAAGEMPMFATKQQLVREVQAFMHYIIAACHDAEEIADHGVSQTQAMMRGAQA